MISWLRKKRIAINARKLARAHERDVAWEMKRQVLWDEYDALKAEKPVTLRRRAEIEVRLREILHHFSWA